VPKFVDMKKQSLILILFILALCASCNRRTVPKPMGYFRIGIPDTSYIQAALKGYPYTFRVSNNAYINDHPADGEQFWIDIQYPMLNTTIHCSYKPIRNNFRALSQDAQEFLYKHTTVASAIPVEEYTNLSNRVWGLYWELHGNTASPIQFILTDSIEHFFRGSVYCNSVPNRDSLAPIYEYIEKDIHVLMESMQWQ
jgi:gliding motility-associated lipoprotein GldD